MIDSKSKMRDEALIAESDNDMEIVSSLSVGFDFFGNLVVEMDYADGSNSRYDYRLDAIVDKDELVLLSKELESFNKSLPLAISDRFGKGWKLLTPSDIEKADELMNSDFCKVTLAENVENLFIDVTAIQGDHRTRVVVQNKHTHITHIEKDGVTVFDEPLAATQAADELLTFDDCYTFAETADLSEVQDRLLQQFTYNMAIAEEGMTHDYGANIGKLIMEEATSLRDKARAYAAAGSDARMGGCSMPVMINCGSGNQGITISVPIWVYAEEHNIPMERRIKALALANLLALYIKQGIGRLSAYCAVVSAASAGAAGVAYLMGEPKEVVEATLSNALAGTSGVVCDGAKPSCAMKIALSVGNALLAYKMARTDNNFKSGEGLVKGTVDRTVATIGDVARVGMKETDIVILESMLEK